MKIVSQNGLEVKYLLDSGQYKNVLLYCHHGLGDAISFYYNILPILKKKYPNINFFFDTHMGQEEYFGYVSKHSSDYDLAINLTLPGCEWDTTSNETKAERCFRIEFDMLNQKQLDVYEGKHYPSPLVGVHFVSTSHPKIQCSEQYAKRLWDAIRYKGLIPIDTHFTHPKASIIQRPFSFEHRNVNDIKPDAKTLFGLIGACSGFAGVSSGNFWTALCLFPPEKILYIETEFPVEKLTRLPVHHMKDYSEKIVNEWLEDVTKN